LGRLWHRIRCTLDHAPSRRHPCLKLEVLLLCDEIAGTLQAIDRPSDASGVE
jgi:hypothetical protein